jgi:hypothetical protein
MNSDEKPHWNADSSVNSVVRWSPVFRISKPFLSKFITSSSLQRCALVLISTYAECIGSFCDPLEE